MTTPELEEKLLATVAELRDATDNLTDLAREWAKADHYYRHAKAIAYLSSDGKTVADKQAQVDKVCKEEREKAHTADALREAQREKVRALMAELTAYQTIAANMRADMNLAGRYET